MSGKGIIARHGIDILYAIEYDFGGGFAGVEFYLIEKARDERIDHYLHDNDPLVSLRIFEFRRQKSTESDIV
jgi:hypothetical protein